jgi:5-methylcytosine-specific restriction endonuclease McrA
MKINMEDLWLAQKGNCFYCFRPMSKTKSNLCPTAYTEDHFKPKVKGFKKNGNIVFAHSLCNLKKGHRDPTKAELIRFKELNQKIKERYLELKKVREDLFNKRDL